jgi:hypothetical protein
MWVWILLITLGLKMPHFVKADSPSHPWHFNLGRYSEQLRPPSPEPFIDFDHSLPQDSQHSDSNESLLVNPELHPISRETLEAIEAAIENWTRVHGGPGALLGNRDGRFYFGTPVNSHRSCTPVFLGPDVNSVSRLRFIGIGIEKRFYGPRSGVSCVPHNAIHNQSPHSSDEPHPETSRPASNPKVGPLR